MSRFDLTIVIPAYKEEKRIGKTLDTLSDFVKKELGHLKTEIVVVSADSSDKTREVAQKKAAKFTNFKLLKSDLSPGKGRHVQHGMLRAQGEAVMFMDADLATPLRHLPKFYNAYKQGYDVVIATRNLRRHHPGYARRLLSNTGNLIFRLAGGVVVEDSQCGFKLFSQKAANVCFSKLTIMRWGFDMEVLAIAHANKLSLKTYRINDWVSMPDGPFATERLLKNSLVSLMDLARIFKNRILRSYIK